MSLKSLPSSTTDPPWSARISVAVLQFLACGRVRNTAKFDGETFCESITSVGSNIGRAGMAACIMGHSDTGYCEHCPATQVVEGEGEGVSVESSRVVGVGSHSDRRESALSGGVEQEVPRGWGSLDDGDEGVMGGSGVVGAGLSALDGSLGADAERMASERLREFLESIVVDVRYAGVQCERDCAERAGDALERVRGKLERALREVGSEWARS